VYPSPCYVTFLRTQTRDESVPVFILKDTEPSPLQDSSGVAAYPDTPPVVPHPDHGGHRHGDGAGEEVEVLWLVTIKP